MNETMRYLLISLSLLLLQAADGTRNDERKAYKICDASGGLDLARLVSSTTRNFFLDAIEDVELIREYVSEAATNGGLPRVLSDLSVLNNTLDWEARNLTPGDTTISAGLAYVDDRKDRRIERSVSLSENSPLVGTKQSDLDLISSVGNIFPWIVDRRSVPGKWWVDHQNGKTLEYDNGGFEQLYTAAWIGTLGEAWLYYPPLRVYGHPFTFGAVLGPNYDSHEEEFVKPNLPEHNPTRVSYFTKPYPDTAVPGLSLITAQAPVYFSGKFDGFSYDETYVASTGVDIAVSAVSSYLDVLRDSLALGSFGILVDSDFNTIVISEEVTSRIYPPLTGLEESRVTYDVDGHIVQDRRNQPYLPADTILEDLTKLKNADWAALRDVVTHVEAGDRDFLQDFEINLTGDTFSTSFEVLFDKWQNVANWTLLVFVPSEEIDQAIHVTVCGKDAASVDEPTPTLYLEGTRGSMLQGKGILVNEGRLDVSVAVKSVPDWIKVENGSFGDVPMRTLKAGERLSITFNVSSADLSVGTQSSAIVFRVEDDRYPDCLFREDMNLELSVQILEKDCGSSRVSDTYGKCICESGYVDMSGTCLHIAVVAICVVVPVLLLCLFIMYMSIIIKRRAADSVWRIDPSELVFDNTSRTIGRGSFGKVVLAEYRGSQVAIKKFYKTHARTSSMESLDMQESGMCKYQETRSTTSQTSTSCGSTDDELDLKHTGFSKSQFTKEVLQLSKLRHPCITTVVGALLEKKKAPLLVMEYMEQGSLYELLHNSTVELEGDLILSMIRDITQGIQYLHNEKPHVIHGDLRSHNILLDCRFRAKVSDFGVGACNGKAKNQSIGPSGSTFWMAPELLRRKSKNTAASDVYALGIILFEMYARKEPYEGEDRLTVVQEVCDSQINKRPPVPRSMPAGVAAIMHDCLVGNPDDRPRMTEVASRIRRFAPRDGEYQGVKNMLYGERNFDLLLKVFPRHIAEALRDGHPVEPEHHDCVTIFFSDIVGFTSISAQLSPEKISDMLHRLFYRLDQLADSFDVFKVETIGDAWMGVTNCVKDQSADHVQRIARFGLGAVQVANETCIDLNNPQLGHVQIRVGFHTGPVLSNVIGSHNPHYSLFGDTVNTASRMESSSKPGRIHCSERSALLLHQQDRSMVTTCRGHVNLKGKGKMTTYWLEGCKPCPKGTTALVSNSSSVAQAETHKTSPKNTRHGHGDSPSRTECGRRDESHSKC